MEVQQRSLSAPLQRFSAALRRSVPRPSQRVNPRRGCFVPPLWPPLQRVPKDQLETDPLIFRAKTETAPFKCGDGIVESSRTVKNRNGQSSSSSPIRNPRRWVATAAICRPYRRRCFASLFCLCCAFWALICPEMP